MCKPCEVNSRRLPRLNRFPRRAWSSTAVTNRPPRPSKARGIRPVETILAPAEAEKNSRSATGRSDGPKWPAPLRGSSTGQRFACSARQPVPPYTIAPGGTSNSVRCLQSRTSRFRSAGSRTSAGQRSPSIVVRNGWASRKNQEEFCRSSNGRMMLFIWSRPGVSKCARRTRSIRGRAFRDKRRPPGRPMVFSP